MLKILSAPSIQDPSAKDRPGSLTVLEILSKDLKDFTGILNDPGGFSKESQKDTKRFSNHPKDPSGLQGCQTT